MLIFVVVKIEVKVQMMAPIVFDKILLQHQKSTFHKSPTIGRMHSLMILFDNDDARNFDFDLSLQTIMWGYCLHRRYRRYSLISRNNGPQKKTTNGRRIIAATNASRRFRTNQ